MINVDIKNLEKMELSTFKKIKNYVVHEVGNGVTSFEDIIVILPEGIYKFYTISEEDYIDEGKYSTYSKLFGLSEINEDGETIKEYNKVLDVNFCRTGSYYTYYDFTVEAMDWGELEETIIPRRVIEEHTIVKMVAGEE